jgi:hypothetical protein
MAVNNTAQRKRLTRRQVRREELRPALTEETDDMEILQLRKKRKIVKQWWIFLAVFAWISSLLGICFAFGQVTLTLLYFILAIVTIGAITKTGLSVNGIITASHTLSTIGWILLGAGLVLFVIPAIVLRVILYKTEEKVLYKYNEFNPEPVV